ncbi:MAG: FecR family protein [Desulfuromonadales bacterium]
MKTFLIQAGASKAIPVGIPGTALQIVQWVLIGVLIVMSTTIAYAAPIGSVVAVRGKATIERKGKQLEARPKLDIELGDTVVTAEGGRVKLLFIDDSVLTLAEKSRMNVDTFLHSRTDRGKSLFNLLDGKMRAVVGKTRFEVKTPTVVAAARGTVILFDVGFDSRGQQFTRITCLEGIVETRSLLAGASVAPVLLSPGQSIIVTAGQPLPVPTKLSPTELEKLKRDAAASTTGGEIKLPDAPSGGGATIVGNAVVTPVPVVPTFERQQQPAAAASRTQPTKVNIGVKF